MRLSCEHLFYLFLPCEPEHFSFGFSIRVRSAHIPHGHRTIYRARCAGCAPVCPNPPRNGGFPGATEPPLWPLLRKIRCAASQIRRAARWRHAESSPFWKRPPARAFAQAGKSGPETFSPFRGNAGMLCCRILIARQRALYEHFYCREVGEFAWRSAAHLGCRAASRRARRPLTAGRAAAGGRPRPHGAGAIPLHAR